MRALGLFVIFIATFLLIGALLTYPLHSLLGGLSDVPPHKLPSRIGKLLAIPGFFLFIQWLGLYSRQALGYALPRPLFLRQVAVGWPAGIAILMVLTGALMGLDIRLLKPLSDTFWTDLFGTLLKATIAGLLVGVIEETFFRGALFAAIRRHGSAWSAIVWSSLFYAAMHFIDPVPLPAGEPIGWLSGLESLSGAFWQFGQWATFDSFLALFAVGVFLALVREHTGNIAYCIGLHAGWVLIIKLTKEFTYRNGTADWAILTGSYDGVIGYLAAAWIAALALGYYGFFMRRSVE